MATSQILEFNSRVHYSIHQIAPTSRPVKLESGFGLFQRVKSKLPSTIIPVVKTLCDSGNDFSLTIHDGDKPGSKIYKTWVQR